MSPARLDIDGTIGEILYVSAAGYLVPIDVTTLTDGDTIRWNATLGAWVLGRGDGGGHWEPVTNGDPENPELVFDDGDVVMYLVPD